MNNNMVLLRSGESQVKPIWSVFKAFSDSIWRLCESRHKAAILLISVQFRIFPAGCIFRVQNRPGFDSSGWFEFFTNLGKGIISAIADVV
jgi:hypothetical protein